MFRDVASRLAAWSFDAPSGDESPAAARDAVAAAIFHAWLARILDLALSDEIAALQDPTPGATALAFTPEQRMVALLFLLEHPDRARTLDATTGQSAIWDDLRTPQRETRDVILLRALAAATTDLAALTHRDDLDGWRWGSLHTVRFTSLIPHFSLSLGIDLSIPPPGDPNDPNGFARPGGIDSVDQGWPALEDSNGALAPVFSYTQGPARRLTVEMAPDGPQAFDALPGGESGDVHSVHFRDEAVYWRSNTRHPLPRTEAEVASSAEARIRLVPAM
jgi:penicillin amidase